jgi:hypothetical protein
MAPRRSRPRRLLLPTVLAAVLAAEITGIALARTLAPAAPIAPVAAPASAASSPAVAGRQSAAIRPDATDPSPSSGPTVATPRAHANVQAASHATVPSGTARAVTERITPKVASTARSGGASTGHISSSASFHGQDHVWIPSLGISANVQSFPCSRSRPPDAGIYRWGCAGRNNVYLLGHAWSTFKPLHDAYVGGRLRTGLKVAYADGAGTLDTYSVVWWKVVAPTTAASWAWAPLSRPSMTLQTCVGANSQYRLMVRLVQVG